MVHKQWTEDEIMFIVENYDKMTLWEIAKVLGRSIGSVNTKIVALKKEGKLNVKKHRPYTEEEVRFIIENYGKMSARMIALKLNRPIKSVRTKIEQLRRDGMIKNRVLEEWSDEEIEFLKNNYGKMKIAEIAKALNKNVFTVKNKAIKLGLRKKPPKWTQDEIEYLKSNYGKIPTTEIAEVLGRSVGAIYSKANELGLHFDKSNTPKRPQRKSLPIPPTLRKLLQVAKKAPHFSEGMN